MSARSLVAAIQTLATPGVLIGYRMIGADDANALLPEEAASLGGTPAAMRASGAARVVAREFLARLGHSDFPIRKGMGGAPLWPEGISGSLAHDDTVAIAAVGRAKDVGSLGIDIELAKPLPHEMIDLVMTAKERLALANDPLAGALYFALKEAVYKAVYPLDHVFLEFHDIEIDLDTDRAITRSGRIVRLKYAVGSHVLALALALA